MPTPGGDVADLFSLLQAGSCLSLFVLALTINSHKTSSLWTGYRTLAIFLCWSSLGILPAAVVALVGMALAIAVHRLAHFRRILLQTLSTLAALLITATLATLLGTAVPLTDPQPASLLSLGIALLVGFTANPLIEFALTRQPIARPTPIEIALQVIYLLFILFLVSTNNPGLFLLLIALFLLQTTYTRETDRTNAALQRRAKEVTLLNSVGQLTSDNLDLDDVLWNIYESVARLIQVSIFYIATYDDQRQMLDFRLVVADGKRIHWQAREINRGAAYHIIQHKQPLHLKSSQRDKYPEIEKETPTAPFMDYLGVPLLVGSHVIGVMSVLSTVREDAFGQDEIQVLQTLANQAGLTVRNAILYTRQADLVNKLSRVNESVHQVLFSNNRDSALEAACRTAHTITGASRIGIFLMKDNALQLQSNIGLSDSFKDWLALNPPHIPQQAQVVSQVDTAADTHLHKASIAGSFQAIAMIPLSAGRSPQGTLVAYYDVPHYFPQQEIDLLGTLANQIAAMLESVRLFDVMEQYATEMSQLVQLSRISTSSLDLNTVVHDVADMLQQMTDASRVAIILLDTDTQRAQLLATSNDKSSTSTVQYIDPLPELLHMARSKSPSAHAFHYNEDTLSQPMFEQMTAYNEFTLALVPLVTNNTVLGAVLLGSREPRHFDTREWQFVEMATNQIATQINNVRLYERTQRELNRRLTQASIIEDIAQQVSSSLDFQQIIDHVLEAAVHATDAGLVVLALETDTGEMWTIERRIEDGLTEPRYLSRQRHEGLPGYVLATGQTVIVPNNQAADFYQSDYGDQYRSSIGVPMLKSGEVVGALTVESQQLNAFSTEQAGFLSSLAGHAVMSIENARFVEDRQHEIELLRSLRELSIWLVSADDIRSVGHEILETALQLLQGDQAVLYEYEGNQVRTLAKLWYSEQNSVQAQETLPHDLAIEAGRTGQVVHLLDVHDHPAYSETEVFDYASAVAVPLKRALEVRYIIFLGFDDHRQFIERDTNTIDLLASQAIGHLENAGLHERIRAGRDQMRAILDSTRDGLILLDCDVLLIETNPSAEYLLGMDLRHHIGQHFPDVLGAHIENNGTKAYDHQDVNLLVNTLRTHPEAETRRELQRQNGSSTLYIEEVGLPVRDEQGQITGRLLVLRDITEARLLEEQREDFTDMVVHDLRGPLGAMQSAMELVLPRLGIPEDNDDNAILISTSRDNAFRLLRLVETLLDISRMQRPGLELKRENTTLPVLVDTAFNAIMISAQKADIQLKATFPDDLPPVDVDREKIERTLINLLDNAVRYTPTGGIIQLTAKVLEPGKWIEVRLADSGPGIPPQRRSDIFERFRRVPGQEPRRGHKGHGLGLNFVKVAIERHGGTIRIDDDCDLPGACFIFTLPIARI